MNTARNEVIIWETRVCRGLITKLPGNGNFKLYPAVLERYQLGPQLIYDVTEVMYWFLLRDLSSFTFHECGTLALSFIALVGRVPFEV